MTNNWVDIKNADLILIMGGNAAEAHPCGFKWVTEAKEKRKAKLVVVDPRFTRSAAVSDFYAPLRTGSDIAFLGGVINYLLANDKVHHEYVRAYTNATFVVKNDKGELVNRWITTGFLASSAASNESGYLTHKVVRPLGMAAIDTQARI